MSDADLRRHLAVKQQGSILRPILVWKSSTLRQRLALIAGSSFGLLLLVLSWLDVGPVSVLVEVLLALLCVAITEPSRLKPRNLSADWRALIGGPKQILPPMTAQEFLCGSMERYSEMNTFRAHVQVSGFHPHERSIALELPNRFRLHSSLTGYKVTSVCDGHRFIECSSSSRLRVGIYPAPDSVAGAKTAYLMQPMLCGSLIYRFFEGSQTIDELVWLDKGLIEYGASQQVGNETATEVTFYGKGPYGHVIALIGLETGLVHRLSYDSAELAKSMEVPSVRQEALQPFASRSGPLWFRALSQVLDRRALQESISRQPGWTTHEFENIVVNLPIDAAQFDTTPPEGRELVEVSAAEGKVFEGG